jgi:ATP-dependent Clp protease ATP-binding subunit ClpB
LFPELCRKLFINLDVLRVDLGKLFAKLPKLDHSPDPQVGRKLQTVLQRAEALMNEMGDQYVTIEHIFLASLEQNDIAELFKTQSITIEKAKQTILDMRK